MRLRVLSSQSVCSRCPPSWSKNFVNFLSCNNRAASHLVLLRQPFYFESTNSFYLLKQFARHQPGFRTKFYLVYVKLHSILWRTQLHHDILHVLSIEVTNSLRITTTTAVHKSDEITSGHSEQFSIGELKRAAARFFHEKVILRILWSGCPFGMLGHRKVQFHLEARMFLNYLFSSQGSYRHFLNKHTLKHTVISERLSKH